MTTESFNIQKLSSMPGHLKFTTRRITEQVINWLHFMDDVLHDNEYSWVPPNYMIMQGLSGGIKQIMVTHTDCGPRGGGLLLGLPGVKGSVEKMG